MLIFTIFFVVVLLLIILIPFVFLMYGPTWIAKGSRRMMQELEKEFKDKP